MPIDERIESFLNAPRSLTRKWPLVLLVASVAFLAVLHWNFVVSHEVYSVAVLLMATIAGWSFVGVVYPPFFWAAGKFGKHLPLSNKIAAALSAAAGFAVGMIMLFKLY
jgi:hypothetical protein